MDSPWWIDNDRSSSALKESSSSSLRPFRVHTTYSLMERV